MSNANAHIAGESTGLIDRETADRLRAAEPEGDPQGMSAAGEIVAAQPRLAVAAMFGPGVTISEAFGFLSGGFLLAAWSSFMTRATRPSGQPEVFAALMASPPQPC